MPEPSALLTVPEVARALRCSTKTIRRMMKRGDLVARRLGRSVRVDAESVTRLLAGDSPAEVAEMNDNDGKQAGTPRLLRQRGRSKVWTAWINFKEVPLGTTDKTEAQRKLERIIKQRRIATPEEQASSATLSNKTKPFRVYALPASGGFMIKYYDRQGTRRSCRIPSDLASPIATLEEAKAYAELWFRREIAGHVVSPARADSNAVALSPAMSFEQFGRLWTSGDLARRFPDHVRPKKSADDDESRMKNYVYPIIGAEPLRRFEGRRGVELVEQVLEGLPPVGTTFSRSTRRQVIQLIHRTMTLAVYPAKLLSANPLPRGFVPRAAEDKAKTYLYPDEDEKLMACADVPLQERLFFGILIREGMRFSELLDLTWADVDLDRGMIYLDENKTGDARSWALNPGVAEALRRWRDQFVVRVLPNNPVLADGKWKRLDRYDAAARLREHLRTAGVTRPQLFDAGDRRLHLRAHDLRASFVTVHLALGKSEAWITDRTGHKSSQMIYKYKRAARSHSELNLGDFAPLHNAIPELARSAAR